MTLALIGATVAVYREAAMKYRGFVAAGVMFCGLSAGQLFAQAAAESVLTHGLSSAAGSSLGKTLGNAMGNAASQLGGKLGRQTSTLPSVQRVPASKAKAATLPVSTTSAAPPSSGSLIASIQGGATSTPVLANCAIAKTAGPNASQSGSVAVPAPSKVGSAAATTVPVTTAGANNCAAMQDGDSHPAVVNLPAAN